MFDSRHIGFIFLRFSLFLFLKIINILAFFHAAGIRLSDRYLVYSLASIVSCFQCLNVLLPVAFPFFISRRAASICYYVLYGTSFGSVWIIVFCSLSFSSVLNSAIRSMMLS